jgi:hypothetical protein
MSRRRRSHYRPSLGWTLGVAFEGTLTRLGWPVQEFTRVRCCGSPRASSPHGLTAPASRVSRRTMLRAVASGSRLLPTRPVKDLHLQSNAHAGHTFQRYASLRASSLGAASSQPRGWSTLRRRLECTPASGQGQAADLTVCRACSCSNLTGLRYPSAEWSRLRLYTSSMKRGNEAATSSNVSYSIR